MAQAVLYDTTSGRLTSLYEASSAAVVAQQFAPSGEDLLVVETPLSIGVLDRYVITEAGVTAKTAATLTASQNPFVPDGVASCAVSLDPFVPCTVLVNSVPYALTAEDPTLVLTADVPTRLTISLEWHPTHWASPITVLAQTWIPLPVTSGCGLAASVTLWTSRLYGVGPPETVVVGDLVPLVHIPVLPLTALSGVVSSAVLSDLRAPLPPVVSAATCTVAGTVLVHLPLLPMAVTTLLAVAETPAVA